MGEGSDSEKSKCRGSLFLFLLPKMLNKSTTSSDPSDEALTAFLAMALSPFLLLAIFVLIRLRNKASNSEPIPNVNVNETLVMIDIGQVCRSP